MALSVSEIAARLAAEYHGDGNRVIERVAPIHDATGDAITFISNPRFRKHLADTRAGARRTHPRDDEDPS